MILPDSASVPLSFRPRIDSLRDAYLAVERLIALNLELFSSVGYIPFNSYKRLLRYNLKGVNVYRSFPCLMRLGYGACHDLVAWLVASARYMGVRATPLAYITGPNMIHIVAIVNGKVNDPSRELGMK